MERLSRQLCASKFVTSVLGKLTCGRNVQVSKHLAI